MSARSLFSRVATYVPSDASNPRENRLTEILASVFERVPRLARTLTLAWLNTDPAENGASEHVGLTEPSWSALNAMPPDALRRIRTQVVIEGGRVDLELRFAPAPDFTAHEVVVRVEIKHGVGPHSGQLGIYEDTLPRTGVPHAVVLLAPRADLATFAANEIRPSVAQRSWQRTARLIKKFAADDPATGPVAAWLCDEFCTYLLEEQLMDPEAIRPEHLTALAFMAEANRALALICQRAHEYIASTTLPGPPTKEDHSRQGLLGGHYHVGYSAWWYPPPGLGKKQWNDAWFEWGTQPSNSEAGVQGMFFYAGLGIDKDLQFDEGATRNDWRAQLEQGISDPESGSSERVVFRHWIGKVGRLCRVALPQDVLRGTTSEAQGDSLGRWVEQTYRALTAFGPPR